MRPADRTDYAFRVSMYPAANGGGLATVRETAATETMHEFVADRAAPGATVYTDDASTYKGMPFDHEAVRHSAGE